MTFVVFFCDTLFPNIVRDEIHIIPIIKLTINNLKVLFIFLAPLIFKYADKVQGLAQNSIFILSFNKYILPQKKSYVL